MLEEEKRKDDFQQLKKQKTGETEGLHSEKHPQHFYPASMSQRQKQKTSVDS